jgi:hypothetical protein
MTNGGMTVLSWLKALWPILTALLVVSAVLGATRVQVETNTKNIQSMMDELKDMSSAVQAQAITDARQEQYLSAISEQLKDIKGDLRNYITGHK